MYLPCEKQKMGAEVFDDVKRLGLGFLRLPCQNPDTPNDIDMPAVCQMVDAFIVRVFSILTQPITIWVIKAKCF